MPQVNTKEKSMLRKKFVLGMVHYQNIGRHSKTKRYFYQVYEQLVLSTTTHKCNSLLSANSQHCAMNLISAQLGIT